MGPSTTSGGGSQLRKDCKVVEMYAPPKVTGTLSSRFSELPDLQVLDLGGTEVSGDIEALKNLTELTKLDLYKAHVFGDIAALENLWGLGSLNLGMTGVSGDLLALKSLRKLKKLNLAETLVFGDIAALNSLTKLKELRLTKEVNIEVLGNIEVSGNIAALENLTKLTYLDLENTQVIGDMSALRNLTSLGKNFDIYGTEITCDEPALRAVLRSLGLQAEQLTDLKNFEGVERMLSCRNMKGFLICFLHMIWWIKLDHAWPE